MQPGQLFAGRFAVERLANKGGMGSVYRAVDRATGGPVALKVLDDCSDQVAALFAREAEVLARLHHPGIVEYVAHGRTADGALWLSMEWLEGEDLDRRLTRGPLSVAETLTLGRETALALGAAHNAGVVHRDIKPSNLIIVDYDLTRIKIVDFGIARSRQATRPTTRTGSLLGTPGYMPPEQMVGDKDLDQTADVFALGCVLYECLTRQAAFEGEHVMVVLAKILLGETPRVREQIPEVPEVVDSLIARMMSKDRSRRPRDGAAVVQEIAAIEKARSHGSQPSMPGIRAEAPSARAPSDAELAAAFAIPPDGPSAPPVTPLAVLEEALFLGAPPRFTGHKRELRILEAFFGECIFSSTPGVALVTGLPGAGKSSLCREFLTRHKATGQPLEVWLGKGTPMLRGSPFGLLSRALRRAIGVAGSEPLRVRQDKLRRRLAQHLSAADVQRVESYIGQMIGIPSNSTHDPKLRAALQDARLFGTQLHRAFEDLLAAECAARPLLLILEDLEWGDGSSVELVTAALRYLQDKPLLVIATGPPELRDAFPDLFAEGVTKDIHLGDLLPDKSEELARAAIEPLGVPDAVEVSARIAARAQGNLLLLSELLRAAAELRDVGSSAGPLDARAAVEESVAFLPAEARRVLSAASVFGDAFSEASLFGVLEEGRAAPEHRNLLAVQHWLAVLVERELIVRCAEQSAQGREMYTFRHDLVREVVYASLPSEARMTLHLAAGEWLERAGESEPGALARHFERSGDAGRSVGWCVLCAERSLEGGDIFGILVWAERAIQFGVSGQLLGLVYLLCAEARKWRGEHAEALAAALLAMRELPVGSAHWYSAVGQAALVSGNLGDTDRLVSVFHELRAAGMVGYGEADATFDLARAGERAAGPGGGRATVVEGSGSRARAIAAPVTLSGPYVIALSRVALQLLQAGLHELSDIAFAEISAVDGAVMRRDPEVYASIHRARAIRARGAGDLVASVLSFAAAAQAFEDAGDLLNACVQRVNVGCVNLELGCFAEAEQALRDALGSTGRLGLRGLSAFAQHYLGLALARLGRLEEARLVEAEAIEAYRKVGEARLEAASQIYLAMILALSGQSDEAARQAEAAVGAAAMHPPVRAFALSVLGQLWLHEGRGADALRASEEAMRLLEDLGEIEEGEALVRLIHAEALQNAGFPQIARVAITKAREHLAARAERITVPAVQACFLERVPENARTLALFQAWVGSAPPS